MLSRAGRPPHRERPPMFCGERSLCDGRIPPAIASLLIEKSPHRGGEFGVLEGDLTQYPIVSRLARAYAVVRGDVVGAQQEDDELIDARQLLHEVPGVLSPEQALLDEHRELVRRFGAQYFKAGAAGNVLCHASSLKRTADAGASARGIRCVHQALFTVPMPPVMSSSDLPLVSCTNRQTNNRESNANVA